MAVPQQRNQKKIRGRRSAGHTVRQRRFLLDNPAEVPSSQSFEDWLLEKRDPGDWLEYEYLEEETMEDRLGRPPMSLLDRPESFLARDNDYDPDIGSDLDDFADIFEENDFENEW